MAGGAGAVAVEEGRGLFEGGGEEGVVACDIRVEEGGLVDRS